MKIEITSFFSEKNWQKYISILLILLLLKLLKKLKINFKYFFCLFAASFTLALKRTPGPLIVAEFHTYKDGINASSYFEFEMDITILLTPSEKLAKLW